MKTFRNISDISVNILNLIFLQKFNYLNTNTLANSSTFNIFEKKSYPDHLYGNSLVMIKKI